MLWSLQVTVGFIMLPRPLLAIPDLSTAHFNAQLVRQVAGEIIDFVVDNKLDVLILTETWLQEVGDEPNWR